VPEKVTLSLLQGLKALLVKGMFSLVVMVEACARAVVAAKAVKSSAKSAAHTRGVMV
jgi:hypothetical protein